MIILRIFFCFFFLIFFSIPFLIIAILVFLFIDKKIFFIQKRFGLNRKIFNLIKFSSMENNNNQDNLSKFESYRINKIGSFIRKLHLDEIPQIFNLIKGEINFIGPRPWSLKHDKIYRNQLANRNDLLKKYFERFEVKPGIIGLAQLYNINNETKINLIQRLRYDKFYSQKKSFSLNLYIIFSTIKKILNSLFDL